ncbi:MAG TPA: hypothetical protein VFA95_00445 [Gammaproteobacteria bacterium]|nr:hypothetical protein [Gammaproteobacteria bacterium]
MDWSEADVTSFTPPHRFGAWRDRAVFHRLRCTGAPDEAPPERDPAST